VGYDWSDSSRRLWEGCAIQCHNEQEPVKMSDQFTLLETCPGVLQHNSKTKPTQTPSTYQLSFLAKNVDHSHKLSLSASPTNNNHMDLYLEITKPQPVRYGLLDRSSRAVTESYAVWVKALPCTNHTCLSFY